MIIQQMLHDTYIPDYKKIKVYFHCGFPKSCRILSAIVCVKEGEPGIRRGFAQLAGDLFQ